MSILDLYSAIVRKASCVTKTYPTPTLVAMVTKITEFEHKAANYTLRMKEKSNILHQTGDIRGRLI